MPHAKQHGAQVGTNLSLIVFILVTLVIRLIVHILFTLVFSRDGDELMLVIVSPSRDVDAFGLVDVLANITCYSL